MNRLDPVTFEVVWHRIMQLAEEMGITYFRTSGSHVVITGTDASTAIMTPELEAVAVGPYIVTQANVLPLIARTTIDTCSANPGIGDGDIFVCNDPYGGAIHHPDLASVAPVFHEGEIVAWVGTSGHQVDNGGMDPGGFSIGAVEVHQEGLRIPPVKIVESGRLREDLLRWIDNQVRDPLVALDLRAQVATINVGAQRLSEMFERYGVDAVRATMAGILDYAEEGLREKLRNLPDGTWRQTQYIDHDGHEPNVYRIECALTKDGDRLVVDFGGSSANARGLINSTYAGLHAATLSAVYILLAHDLPWNSGIRRCIELRAQPGTINNARYPAPCAMATISAVIVTIDAVWSCISQMLLESEDAVEAMANWSGSSMAPVFSGISQHGHPYAHTEMSHFGGGGGARSYRDGVETAGIVFNTTPNIPNIETNEQDFPVLYLFRRHLRDSGGPGRFRGGMSGELAYIAHDSPSPMESLFAGTGAYMPNALGLAGGLPGAAVRVMRVVASNVRDRLAAGRALPATLAECEGELEVLEPKHPRTPFGESDVWYHSWQAGGGFGDPITREPARVLRDVLDGAVSREVAAAVYGVVLDGRVVDERTTEETRARMRAERLGEPPRVTPGDADGIIRDDGGVRCAACGHRLGEGSVREALEAAVALEDWLEAAGPARGQDYGDRGFRLRRFACPACATQLHAELAYRGDRLVPPPTGEVVVIGAERRST